MVRTLSALLCALLLISTASGCGNADEEKATKSLAKLMKGGGGNDLSLSKKEADCTASHLVDSLGLEKLKKYDIITKDNTANKKPDDNVKMSKGDADKAATAITTCIDVVDAVTKSAGASFSAEQKKCLEKELTNETMHTMWAAYFRGDSQAASKALLTPVLECAKQGAAKK